MGIQQQRTDEATAAATVEVPEPIWAAMCRKVEALEAELADVRAQLAATPLAPVAAPTTPGAPVELVGRRTAMAKLAGAAAAVGTGALVLGSAQPAAAANGANLILGNNSNSATSRTSLSVTGNNVFYGLGVSDGVFQGAASSSAVFGHAAGGAFGSCFYASGVGSAYGMIANTTDSPAASLTSQSDAQSLVLYNFGTGSGVQIQTESGPQVRLQPTADSPNAAGVTGHEGELRFTADRNLWLCVTAGTPGTWRKLGSPGSSGVLHVLPTPVRVYDSRPGTSPAVGSKTPLLANAARALDLKANNSGVPAGATAALLTVLLVDATVGNGNFTVWANGATKPLSNTLVWGGDATRFSTAATTAVDAAAFCQVVTSNTTDLVLDVVGYYR